MENCIFSNAGPDVDADSTTIFVCSQTCNMPCYMSYDSDVEIFEACCISPMVKGVEVNTTDLGACPSDTTECHAATQRDVMCCKESEVCMAVVGCR